MEHQSIEKLLNISRYIFWLDKNINSEENKIYLKELQKEFPLYIIETFNSIENFEYFLKIEKDKYDFKFIYIILSGNLAEKFFNNYNVFTYTTIIAATIVFCRNKNYHINKAYANDLYLNPGGITTNFIEVIEYINNPTDFLWFNLLTINENNNTIIQDKNINSFGNTFNYVTNLSEITLPLILSEIIKKNLIKDIDIFNFKEFMFSRYLNNKYNKEIISLVKPSLEKSVYIPLIKRAKYFLRLYTLETDFYHDLNMDLTNFDDFGPYKAFILILYFSIQNKIFPSCSKKELYRRTLLSKKEMNEIIEMFETKKNNIKKDNEISSIVYYSKPFLSFSKSKTKLLNFANVIYENTVRVTFILNPPKYNNKIFFSNIDIDELKLSPFNEEEVLFLPLSYFEIEDYKKIDENEYEITLNYLDKYYDLLNKEIHSMKNEDLIQSFYEKVLESPLSEKIIDCLLDCQAIFNNTKDFFIEHSSITSINLHYNKLIHKISEDYNPPKKIFSKFKGENFEGRLPPGFINMKKIDTFLKSNPISINLKNDKMTGYKIWEFKYSNGNKVVIKQHSTKWNMIEIKNYKPKLEFNYYDDNFRPFQEKIKIDKSNPELNEILDKSKEITMAEISEINLINKGYASANLIGGIIGYNLSNIDHFIKSSYIQKAKTISSTIGFSTGLYVLSSTFKTSVPMISSGFFGGLYLYELVSDFQNHILTNKETAVLILKNTANTIVNLSTGIGGFYSGLQIGISFGITSGPGVILTGFLSGLVGGLLGGLFTRYFCSTKLILNCNSFYKNYIPLKFREEGHIPDLFWEGVNKNTKSFALEAIIDQKYKTWCVINIPPEARKIGSDIGETLIKYSEFEHYNPSKVDFMIYALRKEKITKEEWNNQENNKKLIIEVAILEVDNL